MRFSNKICFLGTKKTLIKVITHEHHYLIQFMERQMKIFETSVKEIFSLANKSWLTLQAT